MKRTLYVILVLEILACALLHILGQALGGSLLLTAAFPFDRIGAGLRALSLSSGAGNIAAIVIYCALCLIPAVYMVIRELRGRSHMEDGLLALLCILLFAVFYLMINPAVLARHLGDTEITGMGQALCGVTVYMVIIGYFILRSIRALSGSNQGAIGVQSGGNAKSGLRQLRVIMIVFGVIFVYAIFGSGIGGLISSFRRLTAANTVIGAELTPSYVFLFVQYLVAVLPQIFSVAVVFAVLNLISALEEDEFGESVAAVTRKIGRICKTAVVCILLSQIAVNLAQLALGSIVRSSQYTLSIPLLSVVFVLAAPLLARYFEQARLLKTDNDSII